MPITVGPWSMSHSVADALMPVPVVQNAFVPMNVSRPVRIRTMVRSVSVAPVLASAALRSSTVIGSLSALCARSSTLSDILLLVFGAILVAVVLRTIARPIRAGTSMGERLALLAAGLGVLIVIGGTGYL